jgi:hypothetical protein
LSQERPAKSSGIGKAGSQSGSSFRTGGFSWESTCVSRTISISSRGDRCKFTEQKARSHETVHFSSAASKWTLNFEFEENDLMQAKISFNSKRDSVQFEKCVARNAAQKIDEIACRKCKGSCSARSGIFPGQAFVLNVAGI